MDPLTYFIVWVGTMILASLLRDKPDFDPASAEDLNLPVVSQSHKIPLVIGQGLLTGANSLDTGTLGTKALTVSAGLFGGSQETGVFRYYLDEFFGLAYGPGELLGIQMGDYDLGITPATATGEQFIEKRKLWGDDDSPSGGGFVGYVRFNAGVEAGVIDSVVEARTGNIQPGYPNIATVLLYNDSKRGGAYRGNQVPFKPVKFHYGYYPNPLSHASNHKINGHANVAYFLHDLSKAPLWGRDIGGALDLTAISDMAATLAAEGLGWSRTFYSGDAANMEREALDYVDAVRYRAPGSGLVTYGLIRDDFDVGNLRVLGDADIADMVIEAGSLSVAATEVTITYVDVAEGFKRKTITRPNTAARQMLGRRVPVAMDFLGCPDGATADKIVTREALKLSVPQRKGKLWATREAWDLANGEAIVVNYTPEKITGMIVRVASINRGNITDTDGRVEIDWVEVPFNYGPGVFGDVGSNPATPLAGAPADVTAYHAFEVPDFLTDTPHKLGIFAVDPVGHSYGYDLQIAPQSAGNWFTDSLGQFADPFTISTNYSEQATTIILDGEIESIADHGWADISANGYNLVLLDTANGEEWIAYEDGSYNAGLDQTTLIGVRRGLLDTYPKALISTDDAWLLDEAAVSSHTFGATDNADFRLLDKTAQGTLAEGSATVREHLFTNRHSRPFLPGNIQLNSNLFPAAVTGPVTASWAHRDKTAGVLRDWYDATSYGPEAGVTYKVEWYNHDTSGLLQSTTGISGTSDSWSDPATSYNLRIEITAQRSGVDSHETFVFVTAFSQV